MRHRWKLEEIMVARLSSPSNVSVERILDGASSLKLTRPDMHDGRSSPVLGSLLQLSWRPTVIKGPPGCHTFLMSKPRLLALHGEAYVGA